MGDFAVIILMKYFEIMFQSIMKRFTQYRIKLRRSSRSDYRLLILLKGLRTYMT